MSLGQARGFVLNHSFGRDGISTPLPLLTAGRDWLRAKVLKSSPLRITGAISGHGCEMQRSAHNQE